MTAGFCPADGAAISVEIAGERLNATLLKKVYTDANHLNFAQLMLQRPLQSARPLVLSKQPPFVGQEISGVFFLDRPEQRATRSPRCKVTAVHDVRFEYNCRTGNGSAGSPVMSRDGSTVLGIHFGTAGGMNEGKTSLATRADVVGANLATNSSKPVPPLRQ